MDLLLIREVLQHCLEASALLDVDAEERPAWEAILRDLPPFQIGKHGQLQEWYDDFEEREVDHRHYSHLIGVYPGDLMTPSRLPTFYQGSGRSAPTPGRCRKQQVRHDRDMVRGAVGPFRRRVSTPTRICGSRSAK